MSQKKFGIVVFVFSFIWANAVQAGSKGYYDVPRNHWASGAVQELVDDYQFMKGDPNGNFGGTRAISRYEFAKTISNMIEYYNQEIESDRQDLENMVGVMELFQNQLKDLQARAQTANTAVDSQNETIAELNELVIAVADELSGVDAEPGTLDSVNARLALEEEKIQKLDNKGLVIGTLVKGVVNDVKSVGRGVGNVASKARRIRLSRKKIQEAAAEEAAEQISDQAAYSPEEHKPQLDEYEILETHSQITGQELEQIEDASPEFDQYQEQFDGYYADDSSNVDYLEPIE